MQTKTYNIYTFDELNEKAKEKARDWWKQGNDYPFLTEAMTEHALDLLAENKIEANNVKVFYSLTYCQGDGAMIEMTGKWGKFYFQVKQSGHYYHYNSKVINLTVDETGEDADEEDYDEFNELYIDICQKLARYGYDYIEDEDKDERVDETILMNEYTFLADGTRHD